MSSVCEITDLFNLLESNRLEDVGEVKSKFAECFASVKEPWLISGLVDYYNSTGSLRPVDILVKVAPPHDKYLFDKLDEGIRGLSRINSLELLGHVVRRQPLWLHKIATHSLMRSLLRLLKEEKDFVALMCGLLSLVTLLPMIPNSVSSHFQDIFAIFSRLAAWDNKSGEFNSAPGRKEHLQLGLYWLFHNLYNLYPNNFLDFLKREYSQKECLDVFNYTIKPMLETVKLHPLLVTASKNVETSSGRWKKMEYYEILADCRRYSLEGSDKPKTVPVEDSRFRSRCGTDVSALVAPQISHLETGKSSTSAPNLTEAQTQMKTTITTVQIDPSSVAFLSMHALEPSTEKWVQLSEICGNSSALSAPHTPLPVTSNTYQESQISRTPIAEIPTSMQSHDSGSPPEAAIEATPENTPIKDIRQRFNFPNNSSAVRAIANLSHPAVQVLPSRSQPPSPLKKEPSPFRLADATTIESFNASKYSYRVNRVMHDRNNYVENNSTNSPQRQLKESHGSPLKKSWKDPQKISSVPNSPVPLGAMAPSSGSTDWPLAKPQPKKDGFPIDTSNIFNNADSLNKEDNEVTEISKRGEVLRSSFVNRDNELGSASDSFDNKPQSNRHQSDFVHEEGEEWEEDELTCEEKVARCAQGKHGLHMPHSTSMFDFARKVTRIRYYSQCIFEPLSSSFTKSSYMGRGDGSQTKSGKMRKSSTWPDLKCIPDNMSDTTSETTTKDHIIASSFVSSVSKDPQHKIVYKTIETQTVDVWPLPHEHYLFSDILKNFEQPLQKNLLDNSTEIVDKSIMYSPYDHLDKYIDVLTNKTVDRDFNSVRKFDRDDAERLKEQLQLVQLELHYECHRREVHALRNRRLLGKSRKNWGVEEQNIALKNQVTTLQLEVENLKKQLQKQAMNVQKLDSEHQEEVQYNRQQIQRLQQALQTEKTEREKLSVEVAEIKRLSTNEFADVQNLHAALFEMSQKMNRVMKKSEMGDQLLEYVRLMQRELILCGEREMRLKQHLTMIPPANDIYIEKLNQQYKEEALRQQDNCNVLKLSIEFLHHQKLELENLLSNKEGLVQEHKKQLGLVRDEYGARLKAVEEKYQSVIRINQRLESHCLELLQKVSHSPHTVSREPTLGFSPQSSPLSASLASSEGHGQLLASCIDETNVRNLQMIVNQPEKSVDETNSNCSIAPLDEDKQ